MTIQIRVLQILFGWIYTIFSGRNFLSSFPLNKVFFYEMNLKICFNKWKTWHTFTLFKSTKLRRLLSCADSMRAEGSAISIWEYKYYFSTFKIHYITFLINKFRRTFCAICSFYNFMSVSKPEILCDDHKIQMKYMRNNQLKHETNNFSSWKD